MAVELPGRPLPVAVVLDVRLERAQELAAVLALGALDRLQEAVAVEPQRVLVLKREQQGERARGPDGWPPRGRRRRRARSPRARSGPRGRRGAASRPPCGGWPRRAPGRACPRAPSAGCRRPRPDRPPARRPPRTRAAAPRRRWSRPGAGMPALASSSSRACSPACGSSSSNTSTAASAPIPNGRSRPRSSSESSLPPSASASRSPARRRSVSRTTRSRISSSPTTIEPCRAVRRSKSPRGPRWLTTISQATGEPPRRPGTGTASARPVSDGCWGSNGVRADVARRAATSAPSAFSAAAPGPPLLGWRASSRPVASWTIAEPPIADATEPRIASSPRPSITSRSSRSCTWAPRSRTAYCSLTSLAKARSVIAMNGIS